MMGRKSETRGGDLIHSAGTAKTLLQEYRERSPFRLNSTYVPDAVTDSTRRRELKVARWIGGGCGIAARLYTACKTPTADVFPSPVCGSFGEWTLNMNALGLQMFSTVL